MIRKIGQIDGKIGATLYSKQFILNIIFLSEFLFTIHNCVT